MTTAETKLEAFKTELRALLDKYEASISCDIAGDTHGLICKMEVYLSLPDEKPKYYKLCNGYEMDSSDIK